MKIKKLVLTIGMLSLFVNQANAMSVSNYKRFKKEQLNLLKLHINGVGQGISWSNSFVENKLKEKLYCSPQKISLNTGNFMAIIDKEIDTGRWKGDDHVEMILFFGLEKTFPCP